MSEQIIESLKEWFEKEWLYERHLTSEFIKDKEAFKRGCEIFDEKNYLFEGGMYSLLRKEAGLAEVARINNNLEKYAAHCFRQVEKVFSEFILVNPGRKQLGTYYLNGHDMIQNPTTIKELNHSVLHLLYHTNQDGNISESCLILKLNFIHKEGAYCCQAPDIESHITRIKNVNHNSWDFTKKEQENLFKARLWFNTFGRGWSDIAYSVKEKPVFEAFSHMSFYRNVGSHLNSEYKTFKMPKIKDPLSIRRMKLFYDNPMQVMDTNIESPGFYQRYVNMVLLLYSEYLKNPKLV